MPKRVQSSQAVLILRDLAGEFASSYVQFGREYFCIEVGYQESSNFRDREAEISEHEDPL
jgi:hypothetical protein